MSNIKVIIIVIVGLFFNASINATPTSNEFIPCKKMAVAMLEYCLKDDDGNCWSKSKAHYESCRKDVIQRHIPNYDRIKSEKKIRDELERNEKEK